MTVKDIDFEKLTNNIVQASILNHVHPYTILQMILDILELPDSRDRSFIRTSVYEKLWEHREEYPFRVEKPVPYPEGL